MKLLLVGVILAASMVGPHAVEGSGEIVTPPCDISFCEACFVFCGLPPYTCTAKSSTQPGVISPCEVDPLCDVCEELCPSPEQIGDDEECPAHACRSDPNKQCPSDGTTTTDGGVVIPTVTNPTEADTTTTTEGGGNESTTTETACPSEPETGMPCDGYQDGQVCSYGEECCCGECFASYECTCESSQWDCVVIDACLFPPCSTTTTDGGVVIPTVTNPTEADTTTTTEGGGNESTTTETACPSEPETGMPCDGYQDGQVCSYGEECCCGECFASYECTCNDGQWACLNTDACLSPPCSTTTTDGGVVIPTRPVPGTSTGGPDPTTAGPNTTTQSTSLATATDTTKTQAETRPTEVETTTTDAQGTRSDTTAPFSCQAQDAYGIGLCAVFLGYKWTGEQCVPISGCSCKGLDCLSLFVVYQACVDAYLSCAPTRPTEAATTETQAETRPTEVGSTTSTEYELCGFTQALALIETVVVSIDDPETNGDQKQLSTTLFSEYSQTECPFFADDDVRSIFPSKGSTTEVYDVEGDNLAEVSADIFNSKGPILKGKRYAGQAQMVYAHKWNSIFDQDKNQLVVTIADITWFTTILLPEWKDGPTNLTAETEWSRFLAALTEHHQGHVGIYDQFMEEVKNNTVGKSVALNVGKLPELDENDEGQTDADRTILQDIENAVEALIQGDDKFQEMYTKQDEYDAGTGHGMTQDAVLDTNPPTVTPGTATTTGAQVETTAKEYVTTIMSMSMATSEPATTEPSESGITTSTTTTSTTTTLKKCVWIFDLTRLKEDYRKDKCFCEILELAEAMGKSKKAEAAWKLVLPNPLPQGKKVEDFIKKSDKGVFVEVAEIKGRPSWAAYKGDSCGKEDAVFLDKSRLDSLLKACNQKGAKNKNDLIVLMAVNLLHEVAHWSDDVHKFPSNNGVDKSPLVGGTAGDTDGEEGFAFEKELYGGGGFYQLNNLKDWNPTETSKLTFGGKEVKPQKAIDDLADKTKWK